MNPLLATLGGKLTERWLNLLVLPGALFLAATAVGTTLGHRHWNDIDGLRTTLNDLAARPALEHTGTAALLVALVLLTASAASLAAQFLGGAIEQYWLRFARDPLSHALVGRRRHRWARREQQLDAAYPITRTDAEDGDAVATSAQPFAQIQALTDARNRVALREPTRPTWYGDRMQATADRVEAAYGVDLAALWPRLWLILPEPAVRHIQSAHDSFSAAARLAAWAVGYALLACWWWPALLAAVGCAALARSRARGALEALAGLIEAAVDVHGRELAERIGLTGADSTGLLDHETGDRMSELFRKAE
ncbi:hypothetical protein GCM10010277_70380 [Streptomyces longisporoflavus]|uniref:hypothetical protein n=1 Tax=Streptomyces longisporoflavus TaxID=28044 RepID=UPI00167DE190|nr:hypothetical protein [Streptomyces longisporoflavus]GGV63942.1 hypothetical protein GCM10010277_70380 [Streptomyces longisporoflavus]